MTALPVARARSAFPAAGRWSAFGGASLIFFFLNAATFTSLGVVLFTMGADLHWSMTQAGLSFTVLGLACGLSSPLGAIAMVRLGGRGALCAGAAMLAAGFLLASLSQSLFLFFAAMILLGIGYTLGGNVPGVYLLAGWFGRGASRTIGYYLMLGAFGAACGPPVVVAIVHAVGWRAHWRIMTAAAALIGLVCLLAVRDAGPPEQDVREAVGSPGAQPVWTPRQAIPTPQFLLVCAAMIATMTSVTTNSSVLVAHLVRLGASETTGALVLSAGAITATLIKGASGRLCELVRPSVLLGAGLALQAVGCALLAGAHGPLQQFASALSFGAGWGLAFVSCTILPLDYFGAETGARVLAVVALLTTFAAAGPLAAGMVADRTGGFAPIYQVYAAVLALLAVPCALMRAPRTAPAQAVAAR